MSLSVALGLTRAFSILRLSAVCPSPWMNDPIASLSTGVLDASAKTKADKANKASVGKAKSKGTVKKSSDKPEKRTRPPSAFNLYIKDTLTGRHDPNLPMKEVLREAAAVFRSMKDSDKEKYQVAAAEAKQKYLETKRAELDSEYRHGKRKKRESFCKGDILTKRLTMSLKGMFEDLFSRRSVTADGPKRPLTAYNLYIRDEMPNRPTDHTAQKWMAVLAGRFKTLPADRLETLKALAKKDFERQQKEKENLPKKDKSKPSSGYNLFVQDKLRGKDSGTQTAVRNNMNQTAKAWKALSDEEKTRYNDLAAKEKTNFELRKHLKSGGVAKQT